MVSLMAFWAHTRTQHRFAASSCSPTAVLLEVDVFFVVGCVITDILLVLEFYCEVFRVLSGSLQQIPVRKALAYHVTSW